MTTLFKTLEQPVNLLNWQFFEANQRGELTPAQQKQIKPTFGWGRMVFLLLGMAGIGVFLSLILIPVIFDENIYENLIYIICVGGGCVPSERPQFVCATEGVKDSCAVGSLCLHHSCYISCDTAVPDSCKNADKFNVCKSVTTSSGPHSVCGSDSNLGTECDPTQAKNCASPLVCIDGFCR